VAVRIVIEHAQQNTETSLSACLAFSVENTGTQDAELRFDNNPMVALLPAGMNREFEFLGNHYGGQLYIDFPAANPGTPKVTVIKRTLVC
jgi:hypothetical protein